MHFVIYEKDSIRLVTISNPLFYIDSNDIKKSAIELDLLRIVLSLEYFVYNIAFFQWTCLYQICLYRLTYVYELYIC